MIMFHSKTLYLGYDMKSLMKFLYIRIFSRKSNWSSEIHLYDKP